MLYYVGILVLLCLQNRRAAAESGQPGPKAWLRLDAHSPTLPTLHNHMCSQLYVSPVCFQENRRQDSAGEWIRLIQSLSVDELVKEANHFVSLFTRSNLFGNEKAN